MPYSDSRHLVDNFEAEGPWTFDEALSVAIVCATNYNVGLLGHSFNRILHKFPPLELAKVLSPEQHLSEEQCILWRRATNAWRLDFIPSQMTSEQLEIIVAYKHFNLVVGYIDWKKVSDATKLALLKDLAQQKQ